MAGGASTAEESSTSGIIRSMNPDVKARFEEEEEPTANQVAAAHRSQHSPWGIYTYIYTHTHTHILDTRYLRVPLPPCAQSSPPCSSPAVHRAFHPIPTARIGARSGPCPAGRGRGPSPTPPLLKP
jgi:hypothetical protein